MEAYSFNKEGIYTGIHICQLDQIQTRKTGKNVYLLPANSTWEKPPEHNEDKQIAIWNGSIWSIEDLINIPVSNTIIASKDTKQAENKANLAQWLDEHPLTWTDGNVYGVTEEDQNEMAINLMQYQLAVSAGEENPPLEWHTQKKRCHTVTLEEFTALALAIKSYVYPYRRYQESIKEAIYAAETQEELDAIVIDYSSVSNE